MESAIEEFNLLYPNYLISTIDGNVEVVETCPKSNMDFRRLVVTGCRGYVFPREFAADSVAFYGKANSRPPMKFNSDGIFWAEIKGRKCLFICELKSSFASEQIAHAKEQIIGTLLRLKAQMSILQSIPDWEYHGIIVSYAPTEAQLIAVNKLTSRDGWFSRYLCVRGHRLIDSEKTCTSIIIRYLRRFGKCAGTRVTGASISIIGSGSGGRISMLRISVRWRRLMCCISST